jgi:hypothetical protein
VGGDLGDGRVDRVVPAGAAGEHQRRGQLAALAGLHPAADEAGDVLARLEHAEEGDVRLAGQARAGPARGPSPPRSAAGTSRRPPRGRPRRSCPGRPPAPAPARRGWPGWAPRPGWPGAARSGSPTGRRCPSRAVQVGLGEEGRVVDGDHHGTPAAQRHRVVRASAGRRRPPPARPSAGRSAPRPAGPGGARWRPAPARRPRRAPAGRTARRPRAGRRSRGRPAGRPWRR